MNKLIALFTVSAFGALAVACSSTGGTETPVDAGPAVDAAPAKDAGPAADAAVCPEGQAIWFNTPGCGAAGACSPPPPPCAEEFCGCDGKTIIGCGVAPAPYVHKGKCVADAGACPAGQALYYASAGCDVAPTCSLPPPECAQEYCSCKGATILGCVVTSEPYVHKGKCPVVVDAAAE
jgi:hypothetical protein